MSVDLQIIDTEIDWLNKVTLLRQKMVDSKQVNGDCVELSRLLTLAEKQLEQYEPILKANPQRFVILPIKYKRVWHEYKKAQASFWTAEEITLADDIVQWESKSNSGQYLSDNDRFFIKHILAFFAAADGIVNENLAQRFYEEVQIPEARSFYGFQIAMENIHGETYSLLIDTLIKDPIEKEQLFEANAYFPAIKKLQDWAIKWLKSDLPFGQRLIAFACVEGILFSGPFCAIFWLKKRGLLPGLTFSNELISRDENLHMEFACLLHSLLIYPATNSVIHEIVSTAVVLQKEFINESLPCNLIGMNAIEMGKYIEYVADHLLSLLQCPKLYNTSNPFTWMDLISAQNKTNFFEKRVGEYNRAGINKMTSSQTQKDTTITILEDF